jgi:predicted DNA-binding transcriptional regulator YafY
MVSTNPTGRALQLLSLLQTHRLWPSAQLAEHLGVTGRTVRRDVDRLRSLGYPVDATPGTNGGYRLAAGAHLPPLVLDDDEAVAVALGLRSAATAAIGGIDETALRALAKIEQLLPDRLRRRVSALHSNVVELRWSGPDDDVDPDALGVLAIACRDREQVRFDYRRRDGEHSERVVEPHRLVTAERRWYLVAYDLRRDDWRTFRVDRLSGAALAGGRCTPREIPGGDAGAFLTASIAAIPRTVEAVITVDAPHEAVADCLSMVDHQLVDVGAHACVVTVRGEHADHVVLAVARIALRAPVSAVEPSEIHEAVTAFIHRLPHP